jgi:hypothetical protein
LIVGADVGLLAAVMGADKARTHAAGLVAEALQRCGQVGPQAV